MAMNNGSASANSKKKLLIFIVAYNAETTIKNVLSRIHLNSDYLEAEILVIDDASQDSTFKEALVFNHSDPRIKLTILKNPINQGYGGNQKLGYHYAVKHQFDYVVLLHGDGQYAPECIESMIDPLYHNQADAVMGSRILISGAARKGGMPFYKYIGNKILTFWQNSLLKQKFSEFHSGYRAYSVQMLKRIPFEFNSNDFHFDTQIIIQLLDAKARFKEIPIPTYYGSEICYVNGIKYAWNVICTTMAYRIHKMGLFYRLNYDIEDNTSCYSAKLDFYSSHQLAVKLVRPQSIVFDVGCGPFPDIAVVLIKEKSVCISAIDKQEPTDKTCYYQFFQRDLDDDPLPEELSQGNVILLLDILEHLKNPEAFLLQLRKTIHPEAEVLISVPNVAFLPIRLMLLLGRFQYGKTGILDKTHTRLFTYSSLKTILKQSGFKILQTKGIPAPFPKAVKSKWLAGFLIYCNLFFIKLSKRMFAYQFFVKAVPLPSLEHLLQHTVMTSNKISHTLKKNNLP
jgi:glycosyltransferase involved in cell wall biosynthesis